jgi:hypothetical protein
MKTCLAGLMALGLVGLTTDTASARHRLGLGRWPSGRRLYRPALQLWRLWLSPSSPLLRSLLLWVRSSLEVPSPRLGLAGHSSEVGSEAGCPLPSGSRAGRALDSRRQPIANCTAPALIFSHVLTKRLVADDGTMKSRIGFAPALFVCRPFVYFTPAQKGGCSNANSSNFDHYHRCLRGDSGAQTPLQI